MIDNYNPKKADRFFCFPPEPTICEETGRDNCYQCPEKLCSYWAEANEDFHE